MARARDVACSDCGGLMWRGLSTAKVPRCRECRAPKHGDYGMYNKRGCRCELCTRACAKYMRDYAERRRAAGNPIPYSSYRATVASVCESCGEQFEARLDSTVGRFCSNSCANDAQGRNEKPKFRISDSARLAIYEAAGWECQLCFVDIDRTAHYLSPLAPTLDHIQPRARGGSDLPENLRLACRDCNNKRGTDVDWRPRSALTV